MLTLWGVMGSYACCFLPILQVAIAASMLIAMVLIVIGSINFRGLKDIKTLTRLTNFLNRLGGK